MAVRIHIGVILLFGQFLWAATTLAQGRILFVDSYNAGYVWSDGIRRGVAGVLKGSETELTVTMMDTKRHRSEAFKQAAALKVKALIGELKPDVVIAADDNASKYLIKPFFRNTALPFVFCGVNWDAGVYGFPCSNVTGMIEVAPVPQLLDYLKHYAKGGRVGFLAPDLLSAKKESIEYRKAFGIDLVEYFSSDPDDWKKGFLHMQQNVDMLIIDSDGGLYQDRAEELVKFVEANTRIPSGTILDFMAPYVLIAFAKIPEEQGAWAAETALRILAGEKPSSISIARNQDGYLIINARIAQRTGFNIPYSVLKSAHRIIE